MLTKRAPEGSPMSASYVGGTGEDHGRRVERDRLSKYGPGQKLIDRAMLVGWW